MITIVFLKIHLVFNDAFFNALRVNGQIKLLPGELWIFWILIYLGFHYFPENGIAEIF